MGMCLRLVGYLIILPAHLKFFGFCFSSLKCRSYCMKASLFFSCVNTQLWLHKHLKHQKMRNPWVSLCKWYKSKQKQNLFTKQITLMMLYGLHLTHLWRLQVLSLFHSFHIHFVAVFTFQSEALLRHLPEY